MLSSTMQAALNEQINAEMSAYYTYLSMAAYFEDQDLKGFAAWMRRHSDEELMHAMKFYDFVNGRRGRVLLQALAGPQTEWPNPLAAFESALAHEQHVTSLINKLVDLSIRESDHATNSFLQWFVDEQVEEEAVVDAVIKDLRRVGDFGPGLFLLDRELSTQAATPTASTNAG